MCTATLVTGRGGYTVATPTVLPVGSHLMFATCVGRLAGNQLVSQSPTTSFTVTTLTAGTVGYSGDWLVGADGDLFAVDDAR